VTSLVVVAFIRLPRTVSGSPCPCECHDAAAAEQLLRLAASVVGNGGPAASEGFAVIVGDGLRAVLRMADRTGCRGAMVANVGLRLLFRGCVMARIRRHPGQGRVMVAAAPQPHSAAPPWLSNSLIGFGRFLALWCSGRHWTRRWGDRTVGPGRCAK